MTRGRRLLVTTARMPYAVDEIRKLGRRGHTVHASDTFWNAPGLHSRWIEKRHVTPSVRYETPAFLDSIVEIVRDYDIDVVLPMFEEVFYLRRYADVLADRVEVFAPSFSALDRLHDKIKFVELCREIGVKTPETVVAYDAAQLKDAVGAFPEYFGRPAHSRGGVYLLTNTGPLAGVVPLEKCRPTESNPWLVQPFVRGLDICTFSVARKGRVTAHAAYVHPKTIESAGGIVYESTVEDDAFAAVEKFVEATNFDGQVSFDFLRTESGLSAVECNPRPTAGLTVMPADMLDEALFGPISAKPRVAPAGTRRHILSALVRDMFQHWRDIPSDWRELMSGSEDLYGTKGDRMPGLYQVLSLSHVLRYRRRTPAADRTRSDLLAGYFFDVSWDGEPMPQPTAHRAAV